MNAALAPRVCFAMMRVPSPGPISHLRMLHTGIRLLAFLLLAALPARAQFDDFAPKDLVKASLVADTAAVAPGKPFTAGVLLKLKSGWHTYWQFPGDSGGEPKITWTLPDGFKAGEIQWPIPEPRLDEGDLLTYIYEDEVLLQVQITPPAQLPPGEIVLGASIRWLACEKTCIPGRSDVELKLPAGEPAPANADLFAKWRAQLPKSTPPPYQVRWDRSAADAVTLHVAGVPPDFQVAFFPLPPEEAKPGHPKVSAPAADGSRTITFPIDSGGAPNLAWRGVITTQKEGAPREGWVVDSATAEAPAVAASAATAPAPKSSGFLALLGLGFVGGLILNIMPCVLPVIALKIFGFINQAGEHPGRVARLGLAFASGVFVFFLGLAAIVIALKAAGRDFNWGYLLQNPYSLAGLVALVFVFGLNMLGVFEITLSSGASSKLSELSGREGYGGAFLHGLFTTLLGTSCTAPFLAPALGGAVLLPAAGIVLFFLAVAAGMSAPYVLLTARPAWMRFLPKPGMWMDRAKQILGFVMLAVAAWLFGVLGKRGPEVVAAMSWFVLVLGLACWVFGVMTRRSVAALVAVLLIAGGYFTFLHPALALPPRKPGDQPVSKGGIPWQTFSEEKVKAAVVSGVPVFVDFTADWCLNCKAFERLVIETEPVRAAFREKKVVAFKADWTNGDPEITRALKSFGRVGVPLYVLYRPGEKEPVVLDALTQPSFLEELAKIRR
jgi:thiol:disulfide interchange protein/DsbC/DsbD-like thiol-disulfide interchange protein